MRNLTIGFLLIAAFSTCKSNDSKTSLPIYGTRQAVTKIVDGKSVTDTIYQTIPKFKFVNQYGDSISNKDLDGKIYVADFFFTTCPSICPQMARNMLKVYGTYKNSADVRILSHSIDPKHDSVPVLKKYADKLGVKKEALQKYRQTVESLNSIVNPETNETVIEELRALISKIIAKRLKPQIAPQYPMIEGEDLVDPAQLVADVKAGNLEPRVWETYELREKSGKKFGEVEITLICDRSTSMDDNGGAKRREQQKAAVLLLEALKDFADICEAERVNMESPLEVRSEVYSFQSSSDDAKPLKLMSKELGEKERVDIFGRLSTTSGSTTDFVPLGVIEKGLTDEIKKKIIEGEIKKIVIVFTDGGSDDVSKVQSALNKLREAKVVVIGVGITESGQPALSTYAPNARLAKTAEKLPLILGDLLKEHLADL